MLHLVVLLPIETSPFPPKMSKGHTKKSEHFLQWQGLGIKFVKCSLSQNYLSTTPFSNHMIIS